MQYDESECFVLMHGIDHYGNKYNKKPEARDWASGYMIK